MLTFKDIQEQVLAYLDQAGDVGHGLDIVKHAIQSAHDKRLSEERWSFMLWPTPVEFTFSTAQTYILHPEALLLSDFWNLNTMTHMKETPSRARFKPGIQDSRFHFEFVQPSPVKSQPDPAATVTVTGRARLKYVNSSDNIIEETLV